MKLNTLTDYSFRYSSGHLCCRVKQGKRLSEFLQKYTDSGTETTHIVGYNILVFKNVKISAGLPLLSMGGISERSSKIRYCIIWRCFNFHGNLSNLTSSEDTLLYLYVIWNMLSRLIYTKPILTLVICHNHVRYHDGVTLYFWRYSVILVCYLKHVESADLNETILTPVICHKHVRYHDGVTLYFSVKFLSVAPKKTRNWYFSYISANFRAF